MSWAAAVQALVGGAHMRARPLVQDDPLGDRLAAVLEAVRARPVAADVMPKRQRKPEKLTAAEAKRKYGRYLAPPWYLIDPKQIPFPDSADFWWSAVARIAKEGKVVGAGGKPNYLWAMRYWKNQVKRHYGFRPKRTRQESMMEGIRRHLKGASRRMGVERQKPTDKQKEGRVRMAAKLIGAQRTQKRRAAELAAQGQVSARKDAAQRGWDTRKAAAAQAQSKASARKGKARGDR